MKYTMITLAAIAATSAMPQNIERVYNRDTHEGFNIKGATSETMVRGPIYKQRTVLTYDNPYQKLTEASIWFSLQHAAVLSGFGYWFKTEYVPGVLMDKRKAWFIYTAITSRNEDPGIMVQTSPSSYHAQIYPLAVGYDLRAELTSIGFLSPKGDGYQVPAPQVNGKVPVVQKVSAKDAAAVKPYDPTGSKPVEISYERLNNSIQVDVYAQRHKDGYTYVAGILHTDRPNDHFTIRGLSNVLWTRPYGSSKEDGSVKYFIGRRRGSGMVTFHQTNPKEGIDNRLTKRIYGNEKGADTSKLWAHQKLVQGEWRRSKDVLDFSLKYQIPSAQTALLAVPQEQMKLFKEKEAEFQRKQAEEKRKQRAWQNQRRQNWNQSGGGDPEIRIQLPQAVRVIATLPNGTEFALVRDKNGFWGGNFDIPADAPEGDFVVKITWFDRDGLSHEESLVTKVDRTAPQGTIEESNGMFTLRSEPGLAKVTALLATGEEVQMVEMEPGVYSVPSKGRRLIRVVLIDLAHNLTDLTWQPSLSLR